MKDINNVSGEYLVNVNTNKVDVRIGVYADWNSMTKEARTGWYESDHEHFTFDRESSRRGLEKMIEDLVGEDGYEGMAKFGANFITEDHIDAFISILNDITRVPAFLAIEECGEMIDPDIDVNTREKSIG